MKVSWCPGEPNGTPCRGGWCSRVMERAGGQAIAMVRPVEEGRRPRDVLQLFTVELARAKMTNPQTGETCLAPMTAVYEIHNTQDRDGANYWTALYHGTEPVLMLLARQPPWDELAAAEQVASALRSFKERHPEDATPTKRQW